MNEKHPDSKPIDDAIEKLRSAIGHYQTQSRQSIHAEATRTESMLRYKTVGFTDKVAKILLGFGMGPDDAYAATDAIWDAVKYEIGK